MIARLNDCCMACDSCGARVCFDTFPINTCTHQHAICEECRPGNCLECAIDVAEEVARGGGS